MAPRSASLPDLIGAFVDEGYLHLISLLGCGGSAKVYKALDTTSSSDDPAFFAVKCIKDGPRGSTQAALLSNEIRMHDSVADHPGVLSFHRVFVEGDCVFVVFDLCDADMLACVNRQLYVGHPELVKREFVQLLDVVEDCHQHGVFHRDIKPQNILCNSAGTDIRLADFGGATRRAESRDFHRGTTGVPRHLTRLLLVARSRHMVARGYPHHPRHRPHALNPTNCNYATFRKDPEHFLHRLLKLTHEANDIFRWCFHVNPARRPTIAQLRAAVLAAPCFLVADIPYIIRTASDAHGHPAISSASSATSSATSSTLSSPSTAATSSAGPPTPSACSFQPPVAIIDLLDAANVGLAALYPEPLKPTKLYGRFIPPPPPSHLKSAPEFRFLDLKRRGVADRKRFADAQRRTF
ncbi:kinase-like domain-containing protein [Mycena rosella]|uniref:non-specific serine/threonine protein kinase n=1 Tax=Mycena rosella TaxID=1033263 RepID=A0AAD7G561_MYCRO|nr:kinase-like domain-containing protein [Mycena rosella]